MKYIDEKTAKSDIIEIGRRMYDRGFVAANDGNISVRIGENEVLCTCTGVSKGFMDESMIIVTDLKGKVLRGDKKPSSEIKMHLKVYEKNSDIMAVCHAHPIVSTSFAVAGIALDRPILTESVMGVGVIPLAEFGMPGSEDVPKSVEPFVNTHNGCLLANHGVITWGRDVYEAFMRMESVEHLAKITMISERFLGGAKELTDSQIDELIEIRKRNGVLTGGRPVKHE